jgi:prefoldin subunit 5
MKPIRTRIATFFGLTPSTDRAISGITKAIKELDAVREAEATLADALYEQRQQLLVQMTAAQTRALRAGRIASRFADLVEAE